MAKEKKEKPPKKEKAPRKEKRAKKEKEQNEETLLQKLMRQAKIKGEEEEEAEAEAAAEEQEEAGGGKRRLFLLIAAGVLALAAVAVIIIFVILPRLSGGKEEPPPEEPTHEQVLYDLPASYEVGEETVKGVVPLLPDGVQAEKDVRVSYTYIDMTDAGAEAAAYVSNLKEEKFSVVDEEFVRTDEPDYETAEGSVLLAKNLPKKETPAPAADADKDASGTGTDQDASAAPAEEQKDMVLTVELTWAQGTMTVTCDQAEGKVTSPPQGEGSVIPGASMTMSEAVDFLYDLEPSVLGLDGTSMESYHIYAMDGAVLVDGQPCMRLNIYSRDGEGQTNEVAGIYLMSRDGQRLYVLDEEAKSVKELKLP